MSCTFSFFLDASECLTLSEEEVEGNMNKVKREEGEARPVDKTRERHAWQKAQHCASTEAWANEGALGDRRCMLQDHWVQMKNRRERRCRNQLEIDHGRSGAAVRGSEFILKGCYPSTLPPHLLWSRCDTPDPSPCVAWGQSSLVLWWRPPQCWCSHAPGITLGVRWAVTHLILSIILRGKEKRRIWPRSHSGETGELGFGPGVCAFNLFAWPAHQVGRALLCTFSQCKWIYFWI